MAFPLVALADAFFGGGEVGSTLGVYALTLVAAVAVAHRAILRDRRALGALAVALSMGVILFDSPNLLGWLLCGVALGVAVLSPRAGPALAATAWLWRLFHLAVVGLIGPGLDAWRMRRRFGPPLGAPRRLLAVIAIPILGGSVFLALFAAANPIIDQVLGGIRLPRFDFARAVFWLFCLVGVWSFLRPRFRRRRGAPPAPPSHRPIPGVSVASVGLSLAVFNALFALQNGLDIAFLWSGAALPAGVSFAEYAHRGAYALIVTALLAGVFVLVTLRPGSPMARQLWLRRLVVVWVIQNVFLVASSVLRTLNYVEAYSLTSFRIAALLWMGLVAVGLVLICWRLLREKSSGWLIGANVLATGLVLAACAGVDLGAVAAEWNVTHAREAGGDGPPLDLCYLSRLDDVSVVVPLSELERLPLPPDFRARVSSARSSALTRLVARQARWRAWTWRGARRLDRARRLYPFAPDPKGPWRDCDGTTPQPPSPAPSPR
jgi:hypothetical protein